MPLLDHFHAPLHPQRSWESFISVWACMIADPLNHVLPRRYHAEIHRHLSRRVEADAAEFDTPPNPEDEPANNPVGNAVQEWVPPEPTMGVPAVFPDDIEVRVFDERDDFRLVAVVVLVSPGNKDRDETRRAFAAKCATYVQRGVGLLMVDIVTNQQVNLHNELVRLFGLAEPYLMPAETSLYAVAYRPCRRQQVNQIDVWPTTLAVGGALPLLPLALRGARAVPLDLEAAYAEACRSSRL